MKVARRIFCCVVFLSIISTFAYAECPRDFLKIWEISYWPQTGQSQWIELNNAHPTSTYSCGGVEIVSNGGSYSLPAKLKDIPPNGKVLIYFDGKGEDTNDYFFDGDNKAVLHAPSGKDGVFLGNPVGFANLYRVTSAHSSDTLLDFVAWGGEPGEAAKDAVTKRIWSNKSSFIWTSGEPVFGPSETRMEQGGSLGRYDSKWTTFKTANITPGADNLIALLSPVGITPPNQLRLLQTPSFRWSVVLGAEKYELEVATDSSFSNIVFTDNTVQNNMSLGVSLPSDKTYYWRVRSIKGTDISDWSSVQQFTIGFPPKSSSSTRRSDLPSSYESLLTDIDTRDGGYYVIGEVLEQYKGTDFPIEDATVSIGGKSVNTGALGGFAINGLSSGTYDLTVTKELYEFPISKITITVSNLNGVKVIGKGKTKSLGVTPLGARKDTNMLAITRGSKSGRMCDKGATNQAWDAPNPRLTINDTDLESEWCWATTATMINNFYGGTVTQDETVYKIKGDLLHDADAGGTTSDVKNALYYTLGGTASDIDWLDVKPSATKIAGSIDAGNPILYAVSWKSVGGHIITIRGYKMILGIFYVEVVNTDNSAKVDDWEWEWDGGDAYYAFTGFVKSSFTPSTSAIKSDERIAQHSDGDVNGVCDFDKEVRFQPGKVYPSDAKRGLDKSKSDTDDDGIPDKAEIMSWVFRKNTSTGLTDTLLSWIGLYDRADVDRDGLYPEVDPDSDDGGLEDGDEDKDKNGVKDAGETDVFDPKDDGLFDLVFCIDTTASMEDDIAQVKANAVKLLDGFQKEYAGLQVAVVDYRDFPDRTKKSSDYPAKTQLDFSKDKNAIVNAINSLTLGDGGDKAETMYSGIIHAIDNLKGWRKKAQRMIIVMGDAPALDPEPKTGYTKLWVQARAFLGGKELIYKTRSVETETRSGSIPVYTIPTDSSATSNFAEIAELTGGETISALNPSQVTDAILAAVESAGKKPIASLETSGKIGAVEITADASKSRDLEGCGIVKYEWDWNNDGVYDETTFLPVLKHTFDTKGFQGAMKVRVTNMSSESGVAVFVANAENVGDKCPDDPNKTEPGLCGCGVAETAGCGVYYEPTYYEPSYYAPPANQPPTADKVYVITEENKPVSVKLTGSDPDAPNWFMLAIKPVTYSVVTQPLHGTLSGTAPDLTYTPAAGYIGTDSFTFKMSDGTADSAPATVSLVINPVGSMYVDDSLALSISCAEYQGVRYGFKLDYSKSSDPSGLYWKMDTSTIRNVGNTGGSCISVGNDLKINVPSALHRGTTYQFSLNYTPILSDASGHYWKMDLNTFKTR